MREITRGDGYSLRDGEAYEANGEKSTVVCVVSGCSSFACGLMRCLNRLNRRLIMGEGSRASVSRVNDLRPGFLVVSPKPYDPGRTNVDLGTVRTFTNGVPIFNIYLKRRSVTRMFNNSIIRTRQLVRKGASGVFRSKGAVFGNLPGPFPTAHCRSLVMGGRALPTYLRIST